MGRWVGNMFLWELFAARLRIWGYLPEMYARAGVSLADPCAAGDVLRQICSTYRAFVAIGRLCGVRGILGGILRKA